MSPYKIALPAATTALLLAGMVVARSANMPSCDDPEVADTILDTFYYAQQDAGSDILLDALSDVGEIGLAQPSNDPNWSQIRGCFSTGKLSDGTVMEVWFQIVLPVTPDAIGYQLKICTARFDPVHADCEAFRLPPQ